MVGVLPIDILYSMLEHMDHDKPALAALCRVNQVFKDASESVLYRRIVMPLPAVSRVCISLASERLAARVRHFETSKKPGWKPRDSSELLHMRNALRKMTGLRTLRIHFGGPMAWILDGCNFTELRSMLCNLSCDHHLAQFFNRQGGQLADVTLSSIHMPHFPCTIDRSCLPSLKKISADPAWLGMLVPGRPITSVDVWDFTASPWEVDWLLQSSTAVTTLSVSEAFLLYRGAAHVASLVPHLRQLTIKCATPNLFSDEATEKREEFARFLSIHLGYFRSLISFEVQFRGNPCLTPDGDFSLRQLVLNASENALNIEAFIMTFSRSSSSQHTKIVWHRFQEEWKKVF